MSACQVTATDESGRQQRTTYDVLGRVAKTEVFNSGGASVYATTSYTYNGRDQVTRVRQYSGSDSSTTYQDTTMTYDGHGRLKTRKLPIEDTACQYEYYDDDTLKKKTDPRGAFATYTYNARHLVTDITYDKPAPGAPQSSDAIEAIPAAPAVSFGYDEAGNRISMRDQTDSQNRTWGVDYAYDTWSRLLSETRKFADIVASLIAEPLGNEIPADHLLAARVEAVPQPTRVLFLADK